MRKIKIAYVMNSLLLGGVDVIVLNLAMHLDKSKYDVSIITVMDDGAYQINESVAHQAGIKTYNTCDMPGLKLKIQHLKKLKKILLETGPYDIIHSNMDLFNGMNLKIAKDIGVPIRISHAHNSESQYAAETKNLVKKYMQKVYCIFMRKMIRKNATDFFGCSKEANTYINGTGTIINNGIVLTDFKNRNTDTKGYLKEMSIDQGEVSIATVGRLAEQKNPMFIVEIMRELVKLNNKIHLIWVGSGAMEKQITSKIEEYSLQSNITMLGARKDVAQILHCCDYFLFPSKFEGLGIAVIEAQAAGLDCFISETIPEQANLGKCIVLNLSDGARVWAEKIHSYIKSGKHLDVNEDTLRRYDIEYTVEQCENVYNRARIHEVDK